MLDLRLPIGIYFAINSVILVATGLIQSAQSQIQVASLTLNLDIVWGLVMGAFGAFMLSLSLLEKKNSKSD